ncbi:uncharacterized protein LOC143021171 [Oratosquilla oratoria]|uniref:uncharacterized protein LOC143021171 n=1 Tax=Oratosquilla oratoria TaxID=337810 RepID=UPI003F761FB0
MLKKNYNWRDSELENGFKQGLILCCSLASRKREPAIPRRYTRALKELRDNNDILITTADKGGVLALMNMSSTYRQYMSGFLVALKTSSSTHPIKKLAIRTPNGEPMATPSIWQYLFPCGQTRAEIEHLRLHLQQTSELNFTIEDSVEGTIPFLDILVKQQNESFNTSVYTKPTDTGHCLNGNSECPQRYKDATIGAYIRRALTHCSSWHQVHYEIERSTQVLINNGFSEKDIRRQTSKIIDNWYKNGSSNQHKENNNNKINLYYKGTFSTAYKEEERIMKKIIKQNIKTTDPDKILNFIIYYKSKKTSHLLLKNSPQQHTETLQKSHVIYRFNCNRGDCETLPSSYIGMTSMKLSRRLSYHLSSGAPKNHLKQIHNVTLTREILENGTEILDTCNDVRRLPLLEAFYIKELSPNLNIQANDLRVLPSVRRTAADNSEASDLRVVVGMRRTADDQSEAASTGLSQSGVRTNARIPTEPVY